MRNLGDTYFGGIGSYLLYCMVLSFLQLHDSSSYQQGNENNTLASLFVDFFYYWGFLRDYDSVRGLGHVYPRRLNPNDAEAMFCCENPVDPSIDIGKNVRNMRTIRGAFQHAFITLKSIQAEMDDNRNTWINRNFNSSNRTILEHLYDQSHAIFQYRERNGAAMPTWKKFKPQYLPNDCKSLMAACKELCKAISEGMDKNDDATGTITSEPESVPFYVEAQATAQEYS
ncbi:Nucleotidyltransferase Trf4-like [Babesia duncani]|uniref:Nucleotidyltransferase Trf4-like n=1 Tax=Babesia duncani TaxID=323732 RepID=A0AAD9UP69_9APIC|nr:Nucleotidyltransferase Trf4-like [Babesia duncani]